MNHGGYKLTKVITHDAWSWNGKHVRWQLVLECGHRMWRTLPQINGYWAALPPLRVRCRLCERLEADKRETEERRANV